MTILSHKTHAVRMICVVFIKMKDRGIMGTNVIKAIMTIVEHNVVNLNHRYMGSNRMNQMGHGLEEYVKDIFAGTIRELDETNRMNQFKDVFSYLGNQNNPPDLIIKNGDAIEVKKVERAKNGSISRTLALNSSFPKSMLYANSPMITEQCRVCENWSVKDIVYITGVVQQANLTDLSMVYGVDYAANQSTYERIKQTISRGISEIPDVEFASTNELARINRVDPIGITNLRVRGMWEILNPFHNFNYLHTRNPKSIFSLQVIINTEKLQTFSGDFQILQRMQEKNKNLTIKEVRIKDPNNPASLRDAVLITYDIL